ncbi:glycoside hydrolase family 10 protein [Xylanimonas ulmi]|uniref:glycoside hydrolase family 10 protein n=1 Tax=Xylanimonas ulmi TaxID=228973 RepID=UPI0013EE8232|nr:family 10 glycosylhydrolase [Xylanibacterium ulmi]
MRRAPRALLVLALAAVGMSVPPPTASADATEVDRPTVVAADGAQWAIDAVNTGRGAGMLVQYTPDYGFSTFTNPWGAEAVVEATAEPNTYQVLTVGSAQRDLSTSGNRQIPADGFVLSAGPDGSPDAVAFITDHFTPGDLVTIVRPTSLNASNPLAVVDPTPETNPSGAEFPGYRGADQLIQYTPAFGQSTGTNEWGYELVVRSGVVAAVGGANSAIPPDGYVLSGHGVADAFLRANGIVGASVEIEAGAVRIRSDVGTAISSATAEVARVAQAVSEGDANFLDADFATANDALTRADAALRVARSAMGVDDQTALWQVDQALAASRAASYAATPSRVAESRGVWYRPVELDAEAVRATVARMAQTGVNELYLETLWGGYTIYPSAVAARYGLPAQRPEFAGFDALAVWKAETERVGIALHAWVDGLAVGNELGDGVGPIVTTHPEWLAQPRDHAGSDAAFPSANGFYWLDVTDPRARQYFLDVTSEMVHQYGLAGLNLDYMRYPSNGSWQSAYNFSTDAVATFQAAYGTDPLTLSGDDEAAWSQWTTFVESEENRMVGEVSRAVKAVKPGAVVSDAPEAGTEADKIGQWSHVLDVVIPQAYTTNLDAIRQRVDTVVHSMTGGQLVYAGLSAMYERGGADATVQQTQAARDVDAGSVIFAFGQAGPAHVSALSSGPWRESAVSPGVHPIEATRAVVDDAVERIAASYLPRKGLDRVIATTLTARLKAVKAVLGGEARPIQVTVASRQVAALQSVVEREQSAGRMDAAVAARLRDSLGECATFLAYASARNMR